MRRSLTHYRRTHLAVLAAAAVTTAVLTGALLVGDSLRGSLRELALGRLGKVDWAVLAERPFRQRLAGELAVLDGVTAVPALTVRGSATAAESGARASTVALWGVPESFGELQPELAALDLAARSGPFPSAAVSHALATELGVEPGSQLVLSFQRPSDVPRETIVGRDDTDDTIETLRVTVTDVLPDRGAGGFGLEPSQGRPLTVYVALDRLQRALLGRGSDRVNAVLGAGGTTQAVEAALPGLLDLDDLGLKLRQAPEAVTVESRQFVLDPQREAAIEEAARSLGSPTMPVLTYMANALSAGERSVPYSTISALDAPGDPALGRLTLVDGRSAPRLTDSQILLDAWSAAELEAEPGDTVTVEYYQLGAFDELTTVEHAFELAGIVAMEGLATDRDLTPEFPGIEDADDISAWDPPFPVDLDTIRPQDEAYWDDYRAAPKAFVGLELGKRLWQSRFGTLTGLRVGLGASQPDWEDAGVGAFTAALVERLSPAAAGFGVHPLRDAATRAASGATDFAGLFLGLSMFLIASAALVVGLVFRLGVEQRAREIGLLRAVGFPAGRVRRRFLGEGLAIAALGALLGSLGGIAYAWALLAGLRTWWLPAIGEPVLFLHLRAVTLVIGALAAMAVIAVAILAALRRLGRQSTVGLLAGSVAGARPSGSRKPLLVAAAALGLAVAATAFAATLDAREAAGLAFVVGALLLVAGIAAFAWRSGRAATSPNRLGTGSTFAVAARDSARSRGRSLLSVALMSSAAFVIVVVAANRVHAPVDVRERTSGAGGFTLVAEADVPILGTLEGEGEAVATLLDGVETVPFRLLPGEDVSCLNLYKPERPRLLGVPPAMQERGGFTFQQTSVETEDPWSLLDLELEDGVIPAFGDANSVLWILHSGLGQDLELENERGEPIRLRFVGLLSKSVFQSEVLIGEEAFRRHFPSRSGYAWFLLDAPPDRAPQLATDLEQQLSRHGFDAVSTAERLAAFQAVESTYLSTFQTLGGLGLILGTLGLGIVLLRNVLERRAELATLRAIGYPRARLQRRVLAENAYLLLIGLGIGTAAGAIAAAPHLALAGAAPPWLPLAATLGAIFIVGMLSSLMAVRAVAKMPLVGSLRAS